VIMIKPVPKAQHGGRTKRETESRHWEFTTSFLAQPLAATECASKRIRRLWLVIGREFSACGRKWNALSFGIRMRDQNEKSSEFSEGESSASPSPRRELHVRLQTGLLADKFRRD
jgi:hypothetical protein